jgi:hypothetical protein
VIDRHALIARLLSDLPPIELFRAAWLGGSEATGRSDAWSDIDLCLICPAGRGDEALETLLATLGRIAPLRHLWRFPQPSWHGHRQIFAELEGVDPFAQVDAVVIEADSPRDRFLDRPRHGEARVLFDKDGLIAAPPLDAAALLQRMEARLEALRPLPPFARMSVLRACRRGHLADAASALQGMVVRPLVEVLRMRHCPLRFDYGFRYLDRDLPAEARQLLEELCCLPNAAAIEERLERGLARLNGELQALGRGEWTPRTALEAALAAGEHQ